MPKWSCAFSSVTPVPKSGARRLGRWPTGRDTEVSGGVPAEEAFYGHCKHRAGHRAALQLFTEKEKKKSQARKCVVYETIRPVTGTVRAQ